MSDLGTIQTAVELARRVYFEHASGGRLHVVLDDGNLSSDLIRWCLYDYKQVGNHGPTWAEWECGEFWRTLTEKEMQQAYDQLHEGDAGPAGLSAGVRFLGSFGGSISLAEGYKA